MPNKELKPKTIDGKTLDKMPSVMVAIPNMGDIRTDLMLRVISWSRGHKMILFPPQNYSPVSVARNLCVAAFLRGGYDYLFFVDADTVPPIDAIDKLLATGKKIISGVTCNLKLCEDGLLRPAPMVMNYVNKNNREDGLMPILKPSGVEQVDAFGMSCCLIHKSIFDGMKEPWFEEQFVPKDGKKPIGEDIMFCNKLSDMGEKLYADFSIHCDHWKMTKITFPNQIEVVRHDVTGGAVMDTSTQ